MIKINIRYYFVFCILLFGGCSLQPEPVIRLAHISWPGFEALSLAKSENLYKNVNVTNFRFSNNREVIRSFENDLIDVAAVTLTEAIEIQSRNEQRIMIIGVLDISNGGDVIIAKKSISSLNDLKNKRIAVEPSAFGIHFTSRALESSSDIKLTDLQIVPATADRHFDLFKTDKVDAVATYEPSKSRILNKKGHVIFDSKSIPNEIIDVLIVKQKFSENNAKPLRSLMSGYYKALSLIEEHPEKSIKTMASLEEISHEDFKKSLSGIRIPTILESKKLLSGNQPTLDLTIKTTYTFLLDKNVIPKNSYGTPIVTSDFIREK